MIRKYLYVKLPLHTLEQMENDHWLQLFLLIFAASIMIVGFIVPLLVPSQQFSFSLFVIDLLSLVVGAPQYDDDRAYFLFEICRVCSYASYATNGLA